MSRSYRTARGDVLDKIAKAAGGSEADVPAILDANPGLAFKPAVLDAAERLNVPEATAPQPIEPVRLWSGSADVGAAAPSPDPVPALRVPDIPAGQTTLDEAVTGRAIFCLDFASGRSFSRATAFHPAVAGATKAFVEVQRAIEKTRFVAGGIAVDQADRLNATQSADGLSLGWRIDPARKNLIDHTSRPLDGYFALRSATVAPGAELSGGYVVDVAVLASDDYVQMRVTDDALKLADPVCFQAIVWPGSTTSGQIQIGIAPNGLSRTKATVDFEQEAVVLLENVDSSPVAGGAITYLGDGAYLLRVTGEVAEEAGNYLVRLNDFDGDYSFAYPQVTVGTRPSAPILTTGAILGRPADIVTSHLPDLLQDGPQIWRATFRLPSEGPATGEPVIFAVGSLSGTSLELVLDAAAATLVARIRSNGAIAAEVACPFEVAMDEHQIEIAIGAGALTLGYVDGLGHSSPTNAVPGHATVLHIGNDSTGDRGWDGGLIIRSIWAGTGA